MKLPCSAAAAAAVVVCVWLLVAARSASGATTAQCPIREMVVVLAPTPYYSFPECAKMKYYNTEPINETKHAGAVTLLYVKALCCLPVHDRRAVCTCVCRLRARATALTTEPCGLRALSPPTPPCSSSDIQQCNLDCLKQDAFNFTGASLVTVVYIQQNQFRALPGQHRLTPLPFCAAKKGRVCMFACLRVPGHGLYVKMTLRPQ